MIRTFTTLAIFSFPVPAIAQAVSEKEHTINTVLEEGVQNHLEHHEHSELGINETNTGSSAPTPPTDHAADQIYDSKEMAAARQILVYENGGMSQSMIIFDRAEYQTRKGANGYRWEAEAWIGGDINRFTFKTEGEGNVGRSPEQFETQALYSRAIDPWFNLQLGARLDIDPNPTRSYVVLGIEGLAPYWFHVGGALFLSDKGDLFARIQASYDLKITQKLVIQPSLELNFAAQSVPLYGIGSGLSDFETGLRLRYDFIPEFAPYLGVSYERKTGAGVRYALKEGEQVSSTNFVLGVRFWF